MFTFAKAATAVISPLGMCLLLGAVALVCGVKQWHRMAAIIGGFALLWLWFWSTPMVSHALRTALEADFPPVAMADVPTAGAIVVLGGAVLPASASTPYPNLLDGADRVWHAARLHRAGKAPLLLLSGGSSQMDASDSEAAAMQQLLSEWGVPASAMLLEPASRNTAENARLSAEILRQRGIEHILLVTSAFHMARAQPMFEAQGLTVTPIAVDQARADTDSWPWWQRWLPAPDALYGSTLALKELLGRQVARWRR